MTQAELWLFFMICKTPGGFFFAGDTAQTIERGIGFRFCDLQTLFHYEKQLNDKPQIFQLTNNYRSHSGILNLASHVVELIEHFFPLTIDKLKKDRGMYKGPTPVILETKMNDFLLHLVGNENTTRSLEFGAHQVIIVRSQEAKDQLPKELKQCLVMTVHEVKGLEFEDVFIYNYFTDSPENTNWSAITAYQQEKEQQVDEDEQSIATTFETLQKNQKQQRILSFNAERDRILCSELKMLYMVVTRARQRVYFFDENKTRSEPMIKFWKSRNLIAVARNSQDLSRLGTILKKSTPNAWVC